MPSAMKLTSWTLFLFLTTSCSIHEGIKDQKVNIAQNRQDMTERLKPSEFRRVEIKPELYTPSLSIAESEKPSWYFNKITSIYKKMPMRMILDDLTRNLPVTIIYEDFFPEEGAIPLNIDFQKEGLGNAISSVASAAGFYATFNQNNVIISKYKEVIFDIAYLPGTFSNKIGNDTNSSSSLTSDTDKSSMSIEAGNSQYSSLNNDQVTLIDDLRVALEALKTENGKVAVNPLTMTVFIKDTPLAIESMQEVITTFNDQLSKVIALDIVFLDIIYSANNISAFDSNIVGSILNNSGLISGLEIFTAGETATPAPKQFELNVARGDLNGTTLFIDALKGKANISRKYHVPVQLSNGTQSKVMSIDSTMYISEQTVSNVVDGVNNTGSVGAKQSNLITGQIYNVFARSIGDDIIVKLNASFSAKQGIVEKRSEGIYLESPETTAMIFDTTVILESGKTKIISGINSETISVSESNAGYDFLGFSNNGTTMMKETILIISGNLLRGLENKDA